ncbi:MAG: VWA domain-containing protein [Acidobacteriota bacterium]|nr:VWA domain-containing protein [Acidobacteriota bacterium]
MRQHKTRSHVATFRLQLTIIFSAAVFLAGAAISSVQARQQKQPSPGQQQQQQPPADARPRRTTPTQPQEATQTPTPQQQQPSTPKLQTTPKSGDTQTQAQDSQAGQEVGEEEVIKIDSALINLNVRVIDRNNRPVNDVRQDEFRVLENGVPQRIEYFTKEEVPIQYGLVIDNSGSLRGQITQVIDAGKTIINSNRSGDETFVVRFIDSTKIELKQDFTADQNALIDALDEMYIEGGATAVIDAVYLAAERAAEYKKGNDLNDRRRRALILVTDGEDRNSQYKQDQLFARLREEDVQIFVIGFVNELESERGFIRKSKRDKAVELLDRLAKETGGRAFYPTSLKELPDIAKEITRDMRTQYVISYNPTNKARDGSFRAIRVAVADAPGKEKRIAVTRSGYNAGREGAAVAAPKKQ